MLSRSSLTTSGLIGMESPGPSEWNQHSDQRFVRARKVGGDADYDGDPDRRGDPSQTHLQTAPAGIRSGDDRRNADQHRDVRERPDVIDRVEGGIQRLDQ